MSALHESAQDVNCCHRIIRMHPQSSAVRSGVGRDRPPPHGAPRATTPSSPWAPVVAKPPHACQLHSLFFLSSRSSAPSLECSPANCHLPLQPRARPSASTNPHLRTSGHSPFSLGPCLACSPHHDAIMQLLFCYLFWGPNAWSPLLQPEEDTFSVHSRGQGPVRLHSWHQ